MADLVGEYCRLVAEGAAVSDLRLQRLRERMTDEERASLATRFRAKAAYAFRKADELEVWGRSRKVIPLR